MDGQCQGVGDGFLDALAGNQQGTLHGLTGNAQVARYGSQAGTPQTESAYDPYPPFGGFFWDVHDCLNR